VIESYLKHRCSNFAAFLRTQAQFLVESPSNANVSSSKQIAAPVGKAVGEAVGTFGVDGDLVGFEVAVVGASVFFVGDAVGTVALVGLSVGAAVLGLCVGVLVGGCGSTSPNMSSVVKKKLSKFLRLGKTSFISLFGTPNQPAIPLNTASQGVDGIIRPLFNVRGPSSVKLSGYSPRICPPFTDPPSFKRRKMLAISECFDKNKVSGKGGILRLLTKHHVVTAPRVV